MDHRISATLTVSLVLLIASACGEIDLGITPSDLYSEFGYSSGSKQDAKNVSVAIIGGGFAGLSAFQKLLELGYNNVELYEAANRLGGRVYPVEFADGYIQHGAQFINGQENPIYNIAARLGVVDREMDDDELFRNADYRTGNCSLDKECIDEFEKFVEKLEFEIQELAKDKTNWNRTVDTVYNEVFEEFIEQKNPSESELTSYRALSQFYKTYYEGEWSAPITKLSLRNYAGWDDQSEKFASFTLNKFGYYSVLSDLISKLPSENIHLNSKVATIDYRGDKTVIKLVNGEYLYKTFDVVIVTVPLGHLKAHVHHLFRPELPKKKVEAIEKMGFGSLLKVFLVYDQPFWANWTNSFAPLFVEGCSPDSYLSKELHTFEPLSWQSNVLVGWLSGDGPKHIDWISDEELAQHITQHFKNSMSEVDVPEPKELIRTSWLRDDKFRGSYSYISSEAAQFKEDPFELLARPVFKNCQPRILFAGEATHSRIFQTTIGAYLSGRLLPDLIISMFMFWGLSASLSLQCYMKKKDRQIRFKQSYSQQKVQPKKPPTAPVKQNRVVETSQRVSMHGSEDVDDYKMPTVNTLKSQKTKAKSKENNENQLCTARDSAEEMPKTNNVLDKTQFERLPEHTLQTDRTMTPEQSTQFSQSFAPTQKSYKSFKEKASVW
ncbi:unnamed protein product [Bursaphelenchus okinawaensis]|uniref:Amine oxidase domain-containing protein n=1 Tax=Bursaphelenchus okinawaensis TaxID=465554 RepID=A0A811L6A1_9BILA|nr:unnamed protein product [Bursaphelenchus okinawaensis]CAG9117359.1 unnamed protein product [Bursaphelenchus okinawaensis]